MNQINARLSALLERKPIILQLLRFAAIGALNTALDFIILNYVTKSLDVTSGVQLGVLNAISFTAAIIQSYVWNRAWTFSQTSGTPLQNAYRLVLVGGLGFAAFVATILGAAYGAVPVYYLIILAGFIISEVSLWILFGLTIRQAQQSIGNQFAAFLAVSVVGLLINSLIIAIASYFLAPSLKESVNADTVKNIAKALATGVSLIWNFVGYKMIVFKK
ncbi:MAG: GtrA family protein [bacterium]|nr:GtrA family protein [bacterium]